MYLKNVRLKDIKIGKITVKITSTFLIKRLKTETEILENRWRNRQKRF